MPYQKWLTPEGKGRGGKKNFFNLKIKVELEIEIELEMELQLQYFLFQFVLFYFFAKCISTHIMLKPF
jgi:hypothetical protein